MTSTYGASPILKRNKQPLAASTWGRNLTLSLLLHLFSKNEMFHLLCSQAPLIPPKITSRSQWLCQWLISWDYLSTCNILVLSLLSEFSHARWSLLNWERSRYHSPSPWSAIVSITRGRFMKEERGASITMWIIHLCHLFRNIAQIQPPVCPPSASTQQLQALWQTDICSSDCEAANRTEVLQRQESQWLQANFLIHFNQVQYHCDLRIMRAVYNSSLYALRGLFDECVYQGEGLCTALVIWTMKCFCFCQVFLAIFGDCGLVHTAKVLFIYLFFYVKHI